MADDLIYVDGTRLLIALAEAGVIPDIPTIRAAKFEIDVTDVPRVTVEMFLTNSQVEKFKGVLEQYKDRLALVIDAKDPTEGFVEVTTVGNKEWRTRAPVAPGDDAAPPAGYTPPDAPRAE